MVVAPSLLGSETVVVDSVPQALAESAELTAAIADHGLRAEQLIPLHRIVPELPSRASDAITVFKSLGIGLEDVAVAEAAWRRSRQG